MKKNISKHYQTYTYRKAPLIKLEQAAQETLDCHRKLSYYCLGKVYSPGKTVIWEYSSSLKNMFSFMNEFYSQSSLDAFVPCATV